MNATITAAVMLVLAFASVASAECAWVLWSTQATITSVKPREDGLLTLQSVRSNQWEPMQSFVSLAKCEENRDWRSGKLPSPEAGMKFFEYTCLPDTVDPRGAKGGGR